MENLFFSVVRVCTANQRLGFPWETKKAVHLSVEVEIEDDYQIVREEKQASQEPELLPELPLAQ